MLESQCHKLNMKSRATKHNYQLSNVMHVVFFQVYLHYFEVHSTGSSSKMMDNFPTNYFSNSTNLVVSTQCCVISVGYGLDIHVTCCGLV
jgi:predicted nucleic acid binding AN1-type Zn finger protein